MPTSVKKVLPHLRKHFRSPLLNQPMEDGGRPYAWQLKMCEESETAAKIYYVLQFKSIRELEFKRSHVMRITVRDLLNNKLAFKGVTKDRKTVTKWLCWLFDRGFIHISHNPHARVRGGYPDRARYIYVRFDVVDAWLFQNGYGPHPVEIRNGKYDASGASQINQKSGAFSQHPGGKTGQWEYRENNASELRAQQVQNSDLSGDLPLSNFPHPSEIREKQEDPLTPYTDSEPEDQDSPSRTMGTRFSDSSKRGTRHLTWNIGLDPVPEDAKLQQFSRNRWCMALAGMFQIRHITQPEARKVVRYVSKLSVPQMLWAQVVYLPRHPEPWQGSWDDLLARLDSAKTPLNPAWPDTELTDVKDEVNSWLNRNSGPENLQAIFDAVADARVTPMTDDEAEDMHVFATTWREYLKLCKNDASTSFMWWKEQIEFMVIRPKYDSLGSSADMSSGSQHKAASILQSHGAAPDGFPTLNPVPTPGGCPTPEALLTGDVDLLEESIREMYGPQDSAPH